MISFSRIRRPAIAGAALAIVLGALGAASPAQAAVASPMGCPNQTWLQIDSHWRSFVKAPGEVWTGGPGGDLSVTSNRATTLDSTKSGSATVSLNFLIEESTATFGVSFSRSVSTTIGATYHHLIPAGKYGSIAYGSWALGEKWSTWIMDSGCKTTRTGSGSSTLLTSAGFEYWTN